MRATRDPVKSGQTGPTERSGSFCGSETIIVPYYLFWFNSFWFVNFWLLAPSLSRRSWTSLDGDAVRRWSVQLLLMCDMKHHNIKLKCLQKLHQSGKDKGCRDIPPRTENSWHFWWKSAYSVIFRESRANWVFISWERLLPCTYTNPPVPYSQRLTLSFPHTSSWWLL